MGKILRNLDEKSKNSLKLDLGKLKVNVLSNKGIQEDKNKKKILTKLNNQNLIESLKK